MKTDNPFDKKIDAEGKRIPADVRDASIFVVDTLDIAIAGAKALFEDDYKPELALEIYDRIIDKLNANEARKGTQ